MPPTVTLPAAASPTANAHLTEMLRALQDALRAPPAWNATIKGHLEAALQAYDQYIQHVVTAHPMSCRSGCTACCYDNPRGVTGVELRYLQEGIRALPDGAMILAAFQALPAKPVEAEAWRKRQVPCPLLSAQGRCRAYRHRPLACRAFHATTPAEHCDPPHPAYPERVNPHLDPPAVLLQILKVLSERLSLPAPTDLHGGMRALTAPKAEAPASDRKRSA